ncbi:MAG: asparagine synthase (glutamine-hydrolyzing) [Anaerolineae bacterium]|nr:asparagine synthase (glutamine-hydrolyzing) [Anaerolineae bacterium]
MSGICGALALNGQRPDEKILGGMVETLRHRGPDHLGVVVNGPCGLGCSLLAPFGSEAISQPMRIDYVAPFLGDRPASKAWIALDGRLHNGGEIRAALKASRLQVSSDSDAEIILNAYHKYGYPNFIKSMRGAFAFAIWDDARQRLLLARDQIGKKPLYIFQNGEWLLFGSEIKALLAHPAVSRRLNEVRVPHYLAHGYSPGPDTLFDSIKVLPPGRLLTIDLSEDRPEFHIEVYWRLPYPDADDTRHEQSYMVDLLAYLRSAIRQRIDPNRPNTVLINECPESTAIVALLTQESQQPITTLSVGLEGQSSFDENRYTRQLSARFVTEHHHIEIAPDIFALAERAVRHYDQPFGDPAVILMMGLGDQIGKERQNLFVGDGGDALFAGYDSFRIRRLSHRYMQLGGVANRAIGGVIDRLPDILDYGTLLKSAQRIVQSADQSLADYYLELIRLVPREWLVGLMGDDAEKAVLHHYEDMFGTSADGKRLDVISHMLDVNMRTYVYDNLLVRLDRCGMAASLEWEIPFLDRHLLRFALTIPSALKVKRGVSKYILKQALRTILPDTLINRQQCVFELPVDNWFRNGQIGDVEGLLLDGYATRNGLLDSSALHALLDIHTSGEVDAGHILWPLFTFEMWLQRYFS